MNITDYDFTNLPVQLKDAILNYTEDVNISDLHRVCGVVDKDTNMRYIGKYNPGFARKCPIGYDLRPVVSELIDSILLHLDKEYGMPNVCFLPIIEPYTSDTRRTSIDYIGAYSYAIVSGVPFGIFAFDVQSDGPNIEMAVCVHANFNTTENIKKAKQLHETKTNTA